MCTTDPITSGTRLFSFVIRVFSSCGCSIEFVSVMAEFSAQFLRNTLFSIHTPKCALHPMVSVAQAPSSFCISWKSCARSATQTSGPGILVVDFMVEDKGYSSLNLPDHVTFNV